MSFSTIEISLWLEQPRYDAIQRALKESDTDLENVMQGRLEEFYRQIVPGQERQRIDEAIETDRLAAERERIADQKISAFHIVENGQITDFVSKQPMDLLDVARLLRWYLREELPSQPSRFIDCVAAESWLSKWQFENLAEERMEDFQRMVGVYSLDFDQGEVSVMCPSQGWKCYGMRDISVAVYRATRKEWQSKEIQWSKFLEHLNGRETPVQQEKRSTMQML